MHSTPLRPVLHTASEGKDFPRKVGQCSSWVEGQFPYHPGQSQGLGSLTGGRPEFPVTGDLPHSFIMFLPDSSYRRTGGKVWVMRFQNWPLGYEIQKASATPKCLLVTVY